MQATQNSAAAHSLSNKVRLMVTHLGSGTRGLILEKVWVKSGSADSADGKEKVSAIVIFFCSCFLIISGLVSQVSNGASHTRRGWTGGRNQGNGVSRANHWSHQFDPKYLQRLGEPCASGYARNHTRHTAHLQFVCLTLLCRLSVFCITIHVVVCSSCVDAIS